MDHPRPNLRYVDAKDLDDKATKLRGLEVDSVENEKLGKLEGFIIDVTTGRPYHVVVGSGGWFKHKHFLLPIGHVALSPGNGKLIANVPKDRVERYPGFDRDEFKQLSEDDLKGMDTTMGSVCCPDDVVVAADVWESSHYSYPTWWDAGYYQPGRADNAFRDVAGESRASVGSSASSFSSSSPSTPDRDRDRELVVASESAGESDNGVRAQPGDVLGLDTDGERTYIGDTAEDEDKRRRDAEKSAKS
jgi:hypothetical protein